MVDLSFVGHLFSTVGFQNFMVSVKQIFWEEKNHSYVYFKLNIIFSVIIQPSLCRHMEQERMTN